MKRPIGAQKKFKFPGAGRISVKILKAAINLVSKPLTLIYNAPIGKRFPPNLEIGQSNTNFKTGSETDINNYRARKECTRPVA